MSADNHRSLIHPLAQVVVPPTIVGFGQPAFIVAVERRGPSDSLQAWAWVLLFPVAAALIGGMVRGRAWALLYPIAYLLGQLVATVLWVPACIDPRSDGGVTMSLCPQSIRARFILAVALAAVATLGWGVRSLAAVVRWRLRRRAADAAELMTDG